MTASQLLALDLALAVLSACAWTACAVFALRTGGRKQRIALLCLTAAFLLLLGRLAVLPALLNGSWWFAHERATIGLPVAAVPALFAAVAGIPFLAKLQRADETGSQRTNRHQNGSQDTPAVGRLALMGIILAAIGATASVLVTLVLGPFPALWTIAVLLFFVVTGMMLAHVLLFPAAPERKRPRTAAFALASLMAAAALGTGSVAWLDSRAADGKAIPAVVHHSRTPAPPPGKATAVTQLTGTIPSDAAVRRFDLTARVERLTLPSGESTEAWTFGSVPGPPLEATLGEVLEVVLHNRDVGAGVTLHWHGYDVPNAMDGVAGATQDAVLPGQSLTYRFVAAQSGTYWYHTHQDSFEGVRKGLYGPLVIRDPALTPEPTDLVVAGHTLNGLSLLGASDRISGHTAHPGKQVRLRLINTDSLPQRYLLQGADFTVAAVDGTAVHRPGEVSGKVLRIGAGGRLDVVFRMPAHPVTLRMESAASAAVVLHPVAAEPSGGAGPAAPGQPASGMAGQAAASLPAGTFAHAAELDLLSYGQPDPDAPALERASREEVLVLDRQFRFVDGVPRYAYTVNGAAYPNIPPIVVAEGDVVKLTLVNRSAEPHPMHPHGHHVRVLSRNGITPTGSPLVLDTVDVLPGDVWEVLLKADNPGIWMDHCHNLEHAAQGMMTLLQYEGIESPFMHGGHAHNKPE